MVAELDVDGQRRLGVQQPHPAPTRALLVAVQAPVPSLGAEPVDAAVGLRALARHELQRLHDAHAEADGPSTAANSVTCSKQ